MEKEQEQEQRIVRAEKVRRELKILCIFYVALAAFLYFGIPGSLISMQYRMCMIAWLSLGILLYAWIQGDIIDWIPPAKGARTEEIRVNMWPAYLCMVMVNSCVLDEIFCRMNKVAGDREVFGLSLLLTGLMCIVCAVRMGKMSYKWLAILMLAVILELMVSLACTYSFFVAASHPAEDTHTEVQEISRRTERRGTYRGRYWVYYIAVRLPDGKQRTYEVSRRLYQTNLQGDTLVLCQWEAPLGVRFSFLHPKENGEQWERGAYSTDNIYIIFISVFLLLIVFGVLWGLFQLLWHLLVGWGHRHDVKDAYKYSRYHRAQVLESELCGCFHCLKVFPPYEIREWTDNYDLTALCPYCGYRTVIGSGSRYKLTRKFLGKLQHYYFPDEADRTEDDL